jgi:tRNA(adenine34) deaminase
MINDELFMEEALKEAKLASLEDEVPVGAVIVLDGKIISRGHNTRKKDNQISHHAEINAIESAESNLGYLPLFGATIYVTLEPCPMCAYAIMDSHIERVVYGTVDLNKGEITTLDIFNKSLGSKVEVCGNIKQEECRDILKKFFKDKR